MSSLYFQICSMFYIVLIAWMYFSKKKLNTLEIKLYIALVITGIVGLALDIWSTYLALVDFSSPFLNFACKTYLVYLLTWLFIFTFYVFIISSNKSNNTAEGITKSFNDYKKPFNIMFAVFFTTVLLVYIIPLYNFSENGIVYTHGPSANLTYAFAGICIIFWIICLFLNLKEIRNKKYLPVFMFVVIGAIAALIQKIYPEMLLVTSAATFITVLMYFTIENPDVKIINELSKNRELVVKTNEDKSNFLFTMINEVKKPLKDIIAITGSDIESLNIDEMKIGAKEVNNISRNLLFLINNILNESTINAKNIKVVENKYNIYNLIEKIRLTNKDKINDEIEFRINLSSNIPEYLYGDAYHLEQVINSVLSNAIKYTENGFIELNINSIIKYDVCRMIISIEDSGMGMSIYKINALLSADDELDADAIKQLETKNIDINVVKRVINKLGGSFMIRSEEEKGTVVTIVIDQKMDEQVNEIDILYRELAAQYKRVLIASSDLGFIKRISKLISDKGYRVESSVYADDVLNRIRLGEKFDKIFVDDEIEKRALYVLGELKKDKNIKTDIIVMLEPDKEFIKEHFVKDGFNDCLMKNDLTDEVNRIFK